MYVHLNSEDVNEVIRKLYGIGEARVEEPIICKVCWKQSPPGTKECLNCRRPLRIEALQEGNKIDEIRKALEVLVELQAEGKLEEILKHQKV